MSGFLKLNWIDALKGFIVAVLGVIVTSLGVILNNGTLPTMADLKTIGLGALIAGLSYLLKNLLTTSNGMVVGVIPTVPKNESSD